MDAQEKQEALDALKKRAEFENGLVVKAYENEDFRQQLMADPKTVYEQEMGTQIPDSFNIEVVQEKPDTIYLVIPHKVEEAEAEGELSDEALEAVAGGGGWAIYRNPGGGGGLPRQPDWVVAWS